MDVGGLGSVVTEILLLNVEAPLLVMAVIANV